MLEMIGEGPTIYQDIIEEDDDEFTQVWSKGCIHSSLEGGRGIAEAKWHHHKLIMAMMHSKCRFAHVLRRH